jgi:hypothetical protein
MQRCEGETDSAAEAEAAQMYRVDPQCFEDQPYIRHVLTHTTVLGIQLGLTLAAQLDYNQSSLTRYRMYVLGEAVHRLTCAQE